MMPRLFSFIVSVLAMQFVFSSTATLSAAPRALPVGEVPADVRLGALKNLDGYFPFVPSESPQQWQPRAEYLRKQILVSQGLWPMPTRTPINAIVHSKSDMGDYTIEKVFLESYPGHYVTGSLYRPAGDALKHAQKQAKNNGKLPGILCPHGHWPNGRFLDQGEGNAKKYVERGEEFSVDSGRSPLQARCVQLARLGCVVFHYDMLGYADSVQFPLHRPGVRPHMNSDKPGQWGYTAPQAELHLQNMMGLQTYNSIAALDFVASLSDVDSERLAVTGASGGATQTFLLAGVDDRIKVAFPAVMVSTAMQGGCNCENAPYLRINTGNIEFAALLSPRPVAMTAANDWTKEMMAKGYPELQQHFKMMGVPDHVLCVAYLQYGHNYNYPSRQVMYKWFNEHLKLGHDKPEVERDFKYQTASDLTVWTGDRAKPTGDNANENYEKSLLKWMTDDRVKQLAELEPSDDASLTRYKYVIGGGWDVLIGRQVRHKSVEWELKNKTLRDGVLEMTGLLHDREKDEHVPALFLYPKQNWNKKVVIWIDGRDGKASLYQSGGQNDGKLRPDAKAILDTGTSICAIDLLYTGEYLKEGQQPPTKQTIFGYGDGKQAWMKFTGYTYGYNHPLFAKRVHDVMAAISLVHNHERTPDAVDLIGVNGGGAIALAARAQAGNLIRRCAVDTEGFRFGKIAEMDDVNFVPGASAYGDLPGLMALSAPGELWVAGEGDKLPTIVMKAFAAGEKASALNTFSGKQESVIPDAVKWLLR